MIWRTLLDNVLGRKISDKRGAISELWRKFYSATVLSVNQFGAQSGGISMR